MSNYVKATDFSVKDTLVTGDPNKRIKGTEIDDEFDAIAVAVATKANTASPALTGTPTAPTAVAGTNNTQIATTAFVQANGVPIGGIIMWSGLIVDIPSGWQLCDGTNGTPNLRDRFVVGAGSTYATGTTGGSKDAVVVAHSHVTNDPGNFISGSASISTQNSSGLFTSSGGVVGLINGVSGKTLATYSFSGTYYAGFSISGGSHTHNTDTVGSSATNANLPPYYALAFIQRIS